MTVPVASVQVVVPMAGEGRRFRDAGYSTPKPLLPIHGHAMFEVVLFNLVDSRIKNFTIVARQEWNLGSKVREFSDNLEIHIRLIEIDTTTGGPASTVMIAAETLDPTLPVVTANSDQFVNASMAPLYSAITEGSCDGALLTMKDSDPKWSYAASGPDGFVTRVVEKRVISDDATVGIYGFASASSMVTSIKSMMDAKDTVNGEFYVGPAYNYLINAGGRVSLQDLGPINSVMYGMGIPEDYENFLSSPVSRRAVVDVASLNAKRGDDA